MSSSPAEPVTITVDETTQVSGLLQVPKRALACLVLAHGAGAGMTHPFMASVADELEQRQIASLRFQFPYMEAASKRPDAPKRAQAAVRAAVAKAGNSMPDVPLFAGGKSFGGRMTSQAQAALPLDAVRALVFLGFPLHPAGRPSQERGKHLFDVHVPMLFLQGTRDALAMLDQLEPTCKALGERATLHLIEGADHSFHVLKRSGHTDAQVRGAMLDILAAWMNGVIARSPERTTR